jgi:N-acetylglucosaminyldiphosphoundecaprenol N-acetyl-beta-D-mannosaminyltransferase
MPSPIAQGVDLRPVSFEDLSKADLVDAIAHAVGPAESWVGLNAHSVYLAEHDAGFRAVLAESRRFCDGFGTHLLAVLQGLPRPLHRNTPTDFMWDVFARCAELGKTVYLLGDEPGIAERFARLLEERHPGLVCGAHHGFFQFGAEEEKAILRDINERQPHLLCVGMGQPRQEVWTHRHMGSLPCAAVLQIGASMAFAVGARRRGPAWATDHGLEWLFRVLSEPRKMFSRYFVEIPWLISRALLYRLKK